MSASSGRDRRSYPPAPDPLPSRVADNHCHLDIGFDADPPVVSEALDAAAAVGVAAIVQVGVDLPSSQWAAEVAADHEHVWAAVALHPNEAPRLSAEGALGEALAGVGALARLPHVRAVGETGMDFFRTEPSGRVAQEESFRAHIEIARNQQKALVIHDREAHADVLRILDDAALPDVVVMHCFSGDAEFARECSKRGYYMSFAGNVTFKNAGDLRAAAGVVPPDRILVETDAPFLAPMPNRGRPNGSYLMPLTVRALADVRGVDLAQFCAALWANTERAYGSL